MQKTSFENTKLKGRIIAECGSISEFSKKMGVSHQSVLQFLSGKRDWNRTKIAKACEILHVSIREEVVDLFFSTESSHFTTQK